MQKITLPTGYLFVDHYHKGDLETLSIGDYGKEKNVKADFLGLTKEINGVPNGPCKPLSEKWVVTVSTQHGCTQRCTFCSVPNVPFRGNASLDELIEQFTKAIACFPTVRYCERLNVHLARMGEPIFNENVFSFAEWLYHNKRNFADAAGLNLIVETLHPVLTTSMPNYLKQFGDRVLHWIDIKNNLYNGQAGLQFSINSTNEEQRQAMFAGKSLTLKQLSVLAKSFPKPVGRKYCLNFAYASTFDVDGHVIADLFDPAYFMCKITPIHNNAECRKNGIETIGGYSSYSPYKLPEESLKAAGFDVLVFVPSMDEEHGAVTCGNVVLGGSSCSGSQQVNIAGISD